MTTVKQQALDLIQSFVNPYADAPLLALGNCDLDHSDQWVAQFPAEVQRKALVLVQRTLDRWESGDAGQRYLARFGVGATRIEALALLEGALIDAIEAAEAVAA